MKTTMRYLTGTAALVLSSTVAFAAGVTNESTIQADSPEGFMAQYERALTDIQSFEALRQNWVRKASEDVVCREPSVQPAVVKTYPASDKVMVDPEPGQVLAFEATGMRMHPGGRGKWTVTSESTRLVVLDARTKEVVAWNELPVELAGAIHTTAVTPDGRFTYVAGPNLESIAPDYVETYSGFERIESSDTANVQNEEVAKNISTGTKRAATMVKIDNQTLEPVSVINISGRLHHGHQIRNSDYMIMDTFNVNENGHDIMIFDPTEDRVVCGIRQEDLGGTNYTAWSGPEGRYIYIQMEPPVEQLKPDQSYVTAYMATIWERTGDLNALPIFWVARLDLETGKIDREYPYPGSRSNYVRITNDGKSFFVDPSGDDKVVKIDVESGKVLWEAPVGTGPYGMTLNADESELWVLDKGETSLMWGRTITVINTEKGVAVDSMPATLQNDHVLLSPDGKEMWVTSNGEGKVLVYDAKTHEHLKTIYMPGRGDAHGLGFVHFPDGTFDTSILVADQNEFHNGVDPRDGKPLEY